MSSSSPNSFLLHRIPLNAPTRLAVKPNSSPKRRPPQISLGFMMLMTVIFAVISAGCFYASRVQAVQDDLNVLLNGDVGSSSADVGRTSHLVFILFTLTSPLLLAGMMSTGMAILRWLERRR